MDQTIAAISTASAPAGIGIVRISGPQARKTADGIFRAASGRALLTVKGYTALYGRVVDKEEIIDEAVALVFAAPHSYTGEDVVELSCHGGVYVTRRVLRAALDAGARQAQPGEFTRRAFENGKLSLTQAEAVMDIIEAGSRQAARAALCAREGALARQLDVLRDDLLDAAAWMAAWADFPEEDIPEVQADELGKRLENMAKQLSRLIAGYEKGQLMRHGVLAVLAGRPNAGKSTIMNLLTQKDTSIVTDIPGTTRDAIEETVALGGVTLRLTDTAGLREARDPIEQVGVKKTRRRMEQADILLAVFDGSLPLNEEDRHLMDRAVDRPAVAIINKKDLPIHIEEDEVRAAFGHTVSLSAVTGQGGEAIAAAIAEATGLAGLDPSAAMLANERQRGCAVRTAQALEDARRSLQEGMTLDAVSVCLDEAVGALLELSGERASDRVADEVFGRFCVGK